MTVSSIGGPVGGLVLLEEHTASASATLDFTAFISSTYDTYKVVGTDLAPETNAVDLLMRVGTGAGPTYDTGGNYEWGWGAADNASGSSFIGGTASTSAKLMNSLSNNAGYGFGCFEWLLHNLQSTAHRKTGHGTASWTTSAPALRFAVGGFFWVTSGTAVTALRFLMSSGNIASGTIRIYGLEE